MSRSRELLRERRLRAPVLPRVVRVTHRLRHPGAAPLVVHVTVQRKTAARRRWWLLLRIKRRE